MRKFADWGITKEWMFIDEDYPENEVYLETGCPKYAMIKLVDEGHKVLMCSGNMTSDMRKELGMKKSDEIDAKVIQELFHRNPSAFVEFTLPQQAELRKNLIMSEYETVTKDLTALKNRHHAIVKEFGPNEVYQSMINQLEEYKRYLIKKVQPHIKDELSRVSYIKGVGPTLTARVLAQAHPNKFKTKSAYRNYCGYTGVSKKSNKYHRGVKSMYYLITKQTMLASDPIYKPMYDMVKKKELQKTCSDCWLTKSGYNCKKRKSTDQPTCPIRAHEVALNRVATALATEFWKRIHNVGVPTLPEEYFGVSEEIYEMKEGVDVKKYFR